MHDPHFPFYPPTVTVQLCPDHGPFVEQEDRADSGCPMQIDYDGITCDFRDPEARVYTQEGLHYVG